MIKPIADVTDFKQKALYWASAFDTVCYLDSNDFRDPYSKFDTLIAVGIKDQITATTGNAFEDISKASEKLNDIIKSGLPTFEQLNLLSKVTGKSEAELNTILSKRQGLKTEELSLTTQIASLSAFIAKNDSKTSTDTAKKHIETIADVLAKLKLDLSSLTTRELNEGLDLSDDKVKAIEGTIDKLLTDFKVDPNNTIIQKLFGDIRDIKFTPANLKKALDDISNFVNKQNLGETAPKVPVKLVVDDKSFGPDFTKRMIEFQQALGDAAKLHIQAPDNIKNLFSIDGKSYQDFLEKIQNAKQAIASLNEGLKGALQNTVSDFVSTLGEAVGKVFAGDNTNIFGALFNVLGEGIKTLGEALVKYAAAAAIAKIALHSLNPALAAAAGVALIALGSYVESKAPKLAAGGIIPPGFEGDRFPAFLNSGEAVIPLDKLHQYIQSAGGNMNIQVSGTLEGNSNKIVAAIRKASVKYDKTY